MLVPLPLELTFTTYLTDGEKDLYQRILLDAINDDGKCHIKNIDFAKQMNKTDRQVRNLMKQLVDKKMIEITSCNKAKRCIILKPYPIELYEAIYFDEEDEKTEFQLYVEHQIKALS